MIERSKSRATLRASESGRFRALLFSVLGLAAVIVAGLAWQTWKSAVSHRESAERVLNDYASFAAWSFQTRVQSSLFGAINPVFGGADNVPQNVPSVLAGLRAKADSIERCGCAVNTHPQFVFLVDLRNGKVFSETRDAKLAGNDREARLLEIKSRAASSLARGISSRRPGELPYRMIARTTAGVSWIAFYSVRFRDAADPGVIVGFESLTPYVTHSVIETSFSQYPLLPRSLTRASTSADMLSVDLRDETGVSVFRTTPQYPGRFTAEQPIGEPDTALTVVVAMNPSAAPKLLIGGVPQSPARTILPLVSLAVALLGLAFYLVSKREVSALEVRASLSEARLAALRSQIQPHFLFNVLNTIAMLARSGDNAAVLSSVARLSDLLRVLLRDPPRNELPLREEIDFVRQYLELEKERFRDRLSFSIEVPTSLETAIVPSLILQPLVENAVIHGVGKRAGPVSIAIAASEDNGNLRLDVRDTGPGLQTEAVQDQKPGIGLSNSRERLAHLYAGAATLDVANLNGGGVIATIRLPIK